MISIHALLAESDIAFSIVSLLSIDFNPRSPCGERLVIHNQLTVVNKFQSTLSLRRATIRPASYVRRNRHFNPRSPCGERRADDEFRDQRTDFNPRSPCGERPSLIPTFDTRATISIHALLAESDTLRNVYQFFFLSFQSTLSLRRATLCLPPQGR